MSETKRAITELNAGLGKAFANGQPFTIAVDAAPDLFVNYGEHTYEQYSLLAKWTHRRPHILGEIAIVGFAAHITEKSDVLVGAYALGGPEPVNSTLGFRVDDPTLLIGAAQYVGLDPQQTARLYLPLRA